MNSRLEIHSSNAWEIKKTFNDTVWWDWKSHDSKLKAKQCCSSWYIFIYMLISGDNRSLMFENAPELNMILSFLNVSVQSLTVWNKMWLVTAWDFSSCRDTAALWLLFTGIYNNKIAFLLERIDSPKSHILNLSMQTVWG